MKKYLVILVAIIGFGISANAQQKYYVGGMYKDSYIHAYIKEKSPMNYNCQQKLRNDALYIKNNSTETVFVEISYKCVEIDCNGSYFGEKTKYETHKISPNNDYSISGYLHKSKYSGSYYVESFSIIDVKAMGTNSTSSSSLSSNISQSITVPLWAQGRWCFVSNESLTIQVISNQISMSWDTGAFVCSQVEDSRVWFGDSIIIDKTSSSNQISLILYTTVNGKQDWYYYTFKK